MKKQYSILFTSPTGNTKMLADQIRSCMSPESILLFGEPDISPETEKRVENEEILFLGFWTDKGSCDEKVGAYLEGLRNRKIFLFGTAGFGGSEDYFDQILSRVKLRIGPDNQVIGTFMCQGRMPESVRKRYEAGLAQEPERMQALIENFDRAASHPDQNDLDRLKKLVEAIIQ